MDVSIACVCEGSPHEQDTVTLRERLDFRAAITVRKSIGLAAEEGPVDSAELLAVMTEWYCLLGVEGWTLVAADGAPLPVSRAAIRERLLENPAALQQSMDVADAADELYTEAVLGPLLARASASSPTMPTEPSTSAPTVSPASPPRPSKRSSTTSSQTDATATISPLRAGVSSSLQSSASVG